MLFLLIANQSWINGRYSNYKNVFSIVNNIEKLNHIGNHKFLRTFGRSDIMTAIIESAKIKRRRHKKFVEKNKQYLKKLTNAIIIFM